MLRHLKYLNYVLKHKWFVFLAGLQVGGIPIWRLIIHDSSKFSSREWTPYVNRFFSGRSGLEDKTLNYEFDDAWGHHWRNNPHHWEYWTKYGGVECMPLVYAREMVADWMGAGRAITGSWDLTDWYSKTKEKQQLHPATRSYVEHLLHKQGYNV